MGEWKEWQTGAIFSPCGELLSSGSVVTISGLRDWRRRKWWQFWKPLWTDHGELPPQQYVAGDYVTATWPGVDFEDSPDRNPEGENGEAG